MNFLVMVYRNWIFGVMTCYMSAVVPYIMLHCSMLTFIIMAADRYRSIAHPTKRQLNVSLCLVTVWVSSVCAAMPSVTYIHYRDVHHLHSKLHNNGLCWSTGDEYSKVIFVTIFTLPAVIIAFLLVKTSAELKTKEALCKLHNSQSNRNMGSDSLDEDSITAAEINVKCKDKRVIEKEKTTQKYLTLTMGLWITCWIPMKIFGVISSNTTETIDNAQMLDIVQMILLPISAMCTLTTPICFVLMKQSLKKKDLALRQARHHEISDDSKSLSWCRSNSKFTTFKA
ncbi:hypothetical protein EB796_001589 [Bugula neritina]|uniref:G-protein coupled receptors family 1 profile domain-containing protein n=1 Tax=Bugula neritina TaxID=10212 RepID=A0A7J7KPL0_BUGNE|nr:hypothetical protein EB796_001589 [Bugula neritina]